MALAIDTKHLLDKFIPKHEGIYNEALHPVDRSRGRRLQLHRVCVHGTIIHDASTRAQLAKYCGYDNLRQEAALDWQAEQGDDEDEVEVLHHLKQLAATTSAPTKPGISSQPSGLSKGGTTTLIASVQSQSFTSCTQEEPPSTFHRYSVRRIYERTHCCISGYGGTDLKKVIPNFTTNLITAGAPKIVSTNPKERAILSIIWVVQLDFLDLSSRSSTYSTSSPGKRRRTLNSFHQVSPRREEDTSRGHHPPDAKRFKGVRYRTERNRWVAEMKPPKSKNKVSFAEFKSQTEAAHVVDVAFHHYGKPLNFADTPRILSNLPSSAGLHAEEKLKLVKEQTEWMKLRLPSLLITEFTPFAGAAGVVASGPNPFEIHSPPNTSGLLPFSAIGPSFILGSTNEADDGVSQSRPWMQALMASFEVADGKEIMMEQIFDLADHVGVVNSSEDGQSMAQWSVENAIADPSEIGISPEHPFKTLTNVVSSPGVEQPFGRMQSMCMDFCNMSPPLSAIQVWSPGEFQFDVADGSLEQQIAIGCE